MLEWFLYWCVNAWVISLLMCECLGDYCTDVWMLEWLLYQCVNAWVIYLLVCEYLSDFCTDLWMLEWFLYWCVNAWAMVTVSRSQCAHFDALLFVCLFFSQIKDCAERGENFVNIVCTQPRRISAMSLSTRVSQEMGQQGVDHNEALVGYQIRFESRRGPNTRLLYCTTGVMLRQLQSETALSGVSHLIIDEVSVALLFNSLTTGLKYMEVAESSCLYVATRVCCYYCCWS